jgi:tetratricopeptide (TPR) repeat protein
MSSPTFVSFFWQRLRCWSRTRDWRTLLLGGPALLAGTGVVVVGWMAGSIPESEVQARYVAEGRAAHDRQDYRRALTCCERVAARTGQDQPDVLYRLALAAEQVGHIDRAVGLMTELAPPDHKGYAPAHFWWACVLLRSPQATVQARDAAEVHLVRALDGELPDPEAAHGLLGQLYLGKGRLDDAELHLNRAVRSRPQLRLWLARLFAARKDLPRARQEAERTLRLYRGRAKADLDDHVARLTWADATAFLEDYPGAVAILEEGLAATRAGIYRSALARVYLAWYDSRRRDGTDSAGEHLELLSKGLSRDPTDRDLLNRLLRCLQAPGEGADRARALLRRQLAEGKATAYVHFALSVDAFHRGKRDEARLHLEMAHKADPALPLVANNLAWSLAQAKTADLPRALDLINLALKQEPGNPTFRDTRGRIYLKMGRCKDALADLEAALSRSPHNPSVHLALAEAYDRLGNPPLAAEHRRLARTGAAPAQP